jgi:hypothetical protein
MLLGGIDKLGEQLLIRLRKAESVDVRGRSSEDGPRIKVSHSQTSDSRKGVRN